MSTGFTLCRNGNCSRSGWCKRMTYPVPPDRDPEREFFRCSPENNFKYYVRNKAREIYERDYPEKAFKVNNDKLNRGEHSDNNRESGVWEDNEADTEIERDMPEGNPFGQDWVLQLQRSSDRGSDSQSDEQLARERLNGNLRDLAAFFRETAEYRLVQETLNLLSNPPLYGIPTAGPSDGQLDDGHSSSGIQHDNGVTDI